MLDVINRFDFCSYLAVAVFLHVTVRKVADHFPRYSGGMWWAGIATLLLVGGFGYAAVRPAEPETVFGLAIVSWICSSSAALAAIVLLPPLVSLREGWSEMNGKWRAIAEQGRSRKLAQERDDLLHSTLARQPDPAAAQHAEAEAQRLARERAQAQRRRIEARATCDLFYSLHNPEIGTRFTKEMFNDYVTRHLGDEQSPEYVERRADQMLTLLRHHLEKVVPRVASQSMDEIVVTFENRKRQIRESNLHEQDKEVILIEISQEQQDAVRKALREGRL